jgi:CDP-diacylglycerol--glycerol-3-phosphate 3-phosphatidyltransferase
VSAPKRPLISANMVTEARLVTMPLISWLVYRGFATGNDDYLWFALAFGTLIGCTDFVDGYLARKYGPTVFGGLLDPIADKVFIALAYMPFADVGLVPVWACAFMFVREFLVTALRSAYEQRSLSLKTSYLAKAKTWTQMQGIGMMVLFPLIGDGRPMTVIFIVGIVGPLVAAAALYVIKKKLWRGAFWMSLAFGALLGIHLHDTSWTMKAMMGMIVGITWLSGVDYVIAGFTQLRGRGDFNRSRSGAPVRVGGDAADRVRRAVREPRGRLAADHDRLDRAGGRRPRQPAFAPQAGRRRHRLGQPHARRLRAARPRHRPPRPGHRARPRRHGRLDHRRRPRVLARQRLLPRQAHPPPRAGRELSAPLRRNAARARRRAAVSPAPAA